MVGCCLVHLASSWTTGLLQTSASIDYVHLFFFFSSRRRHTRFDCDWSSDVCSSDLGNDIERATDIARNMVCEWGMSELGPLAYGKKDEAIFLGREIAQHRDFSEDTEIGRASCRERV